MTREIISVKDLSLEAGGKTLLEDVSFSCNDNTRAAIVGANGSGKSTLLKALVNGVEPVSGSISLLKGAVVQYVPQFIPPEIIELTAYDAILNNIARVRPHLEDWKANEIISEFGLDEVAYDRPLYDVSGGEANRVLVARALAVQPDFVLLDEPTNHLDTEATIAFEELLRSKMRTPFCIVSHDRELLDKCTQQTLILRDQGLYYFGLPYTKAKQQLQEEDMARAQQRKSEERDIKRLKASADRVRSWTKTNSDLAATHRNMRRRIARMEDERTFVSREKSARVALGGAEINTKTVIRIEEADVTIPSGRTLYHVDRMHLSPGDRAVIFGKNGAGKTTLLKRIVTAYEGDDDAGVKINPQVKIGYFDQELRLLDPKSSMFDHVLRVTRVSNDSARGALFAAGFSYERHEDKIETLSGGEKARLQFVVLRLMNPNVLILDEPTNHIDVDGIQSLEDQILESDATFVMVSHDRRFIDTVANRFFLIRDGELREIGDPDEYYDYVLDS